MFAFAPILFICFYYALKTQKIQFSLQRRAPTGDTNGERHAAAPASLQNECSREHGGQRGGEGEPGRRRGETGESPFAGDASAFHSRSGGRRFRSGLHHNKHAAARPWAKRLHSAEMIRTQPGARPYGEALRRNGSRRRRLGSPKESEPERKPKETNGRSVACSRKRTLPSGLPQRIRAGIARAIPARTRRSHDGATTFAGMINRPIGFKRRAIE